MSVENENNKTIAAETSIIKLIIVREFDKYHLCFIKSIKTGDRLLDQKNILSYDILIKSLC